MYDDIALIYDEIFPLNQAFLNFLPGYLKPNSAVLDLGCGPGDYVGELARQGYSALGTDSSAGMIEMAKSRNPGSFYAYSFTEINQLEGKYDCIYCVGNSLSYLPITEMPAFLKEVSRLMTEGAFFILQLVNWDRYLLGGEFKFDVKKLKDGRTFHRGYEAGENDTVIFHTAVHDGESVQNAWADALYPKTVEYLTDALRAAGLKVIEELGNYEKAPFEPENSGATIIVAQ